MNRGHSNGLGTNRRMAVATTGAFLFVTTALAGCTEASHPYRIDDCVPQRTEGQSVARVWNEALLDAIRRDFPAPTVHSRNLFHVSAAMWDA